MRRKNPKFESTGERKSSEDDNRNSGNRRGSSRNNGGKSGRGGRNSRSSDNRRGSSRNDDSRPSAGGGFGRREGKSRPNSDKKSTRSFDKDKHERSSTREDSRSFDKRDHGEKRRDNTSSERRSFDRSDRGERKDRNSNDGRRSTDRQGDGHERKSFSGKRERGGTREDSRSFDKKNRGDKRRESTSGERRSYDRSNRGERKDRDSNDGRRRTDRFGDGHERKPFSGKRERSDRRGSGDNSGNKKYGEDRSDYKSGGIKRSYDGKREGAERASRQKFGADKREMDRAKIGRKFRPRTVKQEPVTVDDGLIRLNKYIANAGICSRRQADEYIKTGLVEVNGTVITEMGFKVKPEDDVRFDGGRISPEKKTYVLLNKPKGYITTTNDEHDRKTVMDLVANATNTRLFPVGRLDRQTTGVLLFTNDGYLAKKLTHPSHNIKKIYHVVLDRDLHGDDMEKIRQGIPMHEGLAKVDKVSFIEGKGHNEVGVEIHIGWNRVVRRLFEKLGYKVEALDRVQFAGLTKKNVKRGQWRILDNKEVNFLKMM